MKLPIPDDWDGQSWCRYAVCWPQSEKWLAVLRGFITLPQRGRTWDEKTGSILGVQEIGREITAQSLPEKEVIMACGDAGLSEIAVSIQALANATEKLANAQCCNDLQIDINGGFQGTITQDSGEEIPIYGSQPPIGLEEGEFPDEYPDLDSYLVDKCKKAHTIVDGLINTLQNLATITTFNAITLAVLIAASIGFGIIFPPAAIPVAISLLLILTGSTALIAQLASLISQNRDDLICILYEGENVQLVIGRIADFLDLILLSIPASGKILYALKALTLLIANSDTLNTLFSGDAAIGATDADCSHCDCGEGFEFLDNSNDLGFEVIDLTNATVDNPSGNPSGAYQITAHVSASPGFYRWKSPDLQNPYIIESGSRLQSRATQMPPTTFYLELYFGSDPNTPIFIGGEGAVSGDVVYDFPLDDWEGETVISMTFYAAWGATGDFAINYDYIRLVCP